MTIEEATQRRLGGWWNCSISWLWWWLQESIHVLTFILLEMHAFHFWAPRQFYCMIIKNKTWVPTSWVLYLVPFTKMWRFHFASLLIFLPSSSIHWLTVSLGTFLWMRHYAWFWELKAEWEGCGSCFQGIHSWGGEQTHKRIIMWWHGRCKDGV